MWIKIEIFLNPKLKSAKQTDFSKKEASPICSPNVSANDIPMHWHLKGPQNPPESAKPAEEECNQPYKDLRSGNWKMTNLNKLKVVVIGSSKVGKSGESKQGNLTMALVVEVIKVKCYCYRALLNVYCWRVVVSTSPSFGMTS